MSDYVKNESNIIKRAKHSGEEQEAEIDYITKMPESVLIHILTKLTTKEAVQTCILSKGWENSWKGVPNLVASSKHFQKAEFFKRFVSKFLNNRDTEVNLANVDFQHTGFVRTSLVEKLINYAMSHAVESLKVNCYVSKELTLFNGTVFPCTTLKHLHLSFEHSIVKVLLPIKMEFPELIECRLQNVTIQPLEEGDENAEPFTGCKKMTTLSIDNCSLHNDAECLVVGSDSLTNFTMIQQINDFNEDPFFKVRMRTPNLASFCYAGPIDDDNSHLVFEHDLNSLKEVKLGPLYPVDYGVTALTLSSWLRKFTNVNSLTISLTTLKILSETDGGFLAGESLNLGNIKKLSIQIDLFLSYEHQVPQKALTYLLQDSPTAEVTVVSEGTIHWINMDRIRHDYRQANRQP